ncbi:uncharacterized protein [Euwallacea similis]|uniref:uncharacterized protein isoform X2 n=1 Tax=Euwallacea similis TaxID=1736056 RepID=UPI00344E1C11
MELKIKQGNIAILVLTLVCLVSGDNAAKNDTKEGDLGRLLLDRKNRGIAPYMGLISCAMKYDVRCFVDAAEDYLEVERTELLAEADAQAALQSTGRSSSEDKPSHIANTLSRLISELTSMFQNGISGFFKQGKDLDDEDEESEESDEGDSNHLATATDDSVGESRGKKKRKKKKLNSMLKYFAIGLLVYKKICLLLKLFHTVLQFKFFFLAVGGLILHAIKFWLSFKKEAHPTKVIYYEHAQHQHHYGHDEDGHSIWARALQNDGKNDTTNGAELAYNKQKPYYVLEFGT